MIKYFSIFSGIGGFEYGLEQSKHNFECIGYSEIDKFARSIYEKHYPNHFNYGDATKIDTKELQDFDFLVGGFPCQAFSIAGKRKGFDDTRGTLFFEIARILKDKKPRYFLLENVKGLLSHDKGKTFQTILKVLDELGYNVQWSIYNSKNHGVPQNRERIYLKGYIRGECGREVLLEKRDSREITLKEDRRIKNYYDDKRAYNIYESTDSLARTLTVQGRNSGPHHLIQLNNDKPRNQSSRIYDSNGLSITLNASGNNGLYKIDKTDNIKSQDNATDTHNEIPIYNSEEDDNLKIKKVGNVRNGHQNGIVHDTNGISSCLTACDYKDPIKIIENNAQIKECIGNTQENATRTDGTYSPTLTASMGMGGGHIPMINYTENNTSDEKSFKIRKLTPVECERLQAFPDNYTKYGSDGEQISDTQRYKCCGNAVTTNVITAIVDEMFDGVL